ncbi:hypothetical protein C8Q80DRAFT_1275989 [Daedaleopsis nitida]|nr:hypothetical protein C8Q80DRAFT_1275989 [Daedaleopsis nitida]
MSRDDLGPLAPPVWLENHPELIRRNIVLEVPLKPFCAWRTSFMKEIPQYAVKLITSDGPQEADIYDILHTLDTASPNHTLPCDVIRPTTDTEEPFLIMPWLEDIIFYDRSKWGIRPLLKIFRQVIEGIEFLHRLRIAHMDMYDGQVLIATKRQVVYHKQLEAGKIYIIDFGAAQRLQYGPGHQPAIELPECNCKPPLGMTRFDPYSWDIYCTGIMFRSLADRMSRYIKCDVPWVVRRYTDWLVGKERGCATVCHCRPSARRARQVLVAILCAIRIWDASVGALLYPWKLLKSAFDRRAAPGQEMADR